MIEDSVYIYIYIKMMYDIMFTTPKFSHKQVISLKSQVISHKLKRNEQLVITLHVVDLL